MVLNRRERILLAAVLTIAGGYGSFVFVQKAFLNRLDNQQAQIRRLNSEIAANKRTITHADQASGRFDEWEEISLPVDERTAQSLYLQFLDKLVQDCHLEEAAVEPGKTQPGKYFTRIPFTVAGKITLENLTEFLHRFYEPNLMHQVRGLDIHRAKGSDTKLLQVKLSIEGLVLHDGPNRGELLREGQETGGPLLAGLTREDFKLITQKNIFEPHRDPPPVAAKEPEVDAAKFVVLSGLPHVGDGPEAWLYNRLTHENRVLREGDDFDIAGVKGKVVSVARSGIVFEMDDKQWSLKLGKMLREMKEHTTTASSSNETNSEEKPATNATEKPPADSAEGAPKSGEDSTADKPAKVGEKIQSEKIPSDSDAGTNKAGAGS